MKATGMTCPIDTHGRVVLPKELRRTFDIKVGDHVEIFTDDNGSIVLRKFNRRCVICGNENVNELIHVKDTLVCTNCAKEIGAGKK